MPSLLQRTFPLILNYFNYTKFEIFIKYLFYCGTFNCMPIPPFSEIHIFADFASTTMGSMGPALKKNYISFSGLMEFYCPFREEPVDIKCMFDSFQLDG